MNENTKVEVITGYRALVNGKTFLAKTIRKVMRKYGKQMGYNLDNIFSHSGTLVHLNSRVRIVEAVANGLCPNGFFKHYDLLKDDIIIIAPREPFTGAEVDEIAEYALDLIAVNNFYQYWSLLFWLAYVYIAFKWRGKWYRLNLFGKGNKFSNVCFEATHRIVKHVRPKDFPGNSEIASCFDLYDPRRDVIVYRNHPKQFKTESKG